MKKLLILLHIEFDSSLNDHLKHRFMCFNYVLIVIILEDMAHACTPPVNVVHARKKAIAYKC